MTDFDDLGGMTAFVIANSKIAQESEPIKNAYTPLRDLMANN